MGFGDLGVGQVAERAGRLGRVGAESGAFWGGAEIRGLTEGRREKTERLHWAIMRWYSLSYVG